MAGDPGPEAGACGWEVCESGAGHASVRVVPSCRKAQKKRLADPVVRLSRDKLAIRLDTYKSRLKIRRSGLVAGRRQPVPGRKGTSVRRSNRKSPVLHQLYHRFLTDEHSAGYIRAVAGRYSIATLERLSEQGSRISRRAAVLAVGFLGDYSSNATLGRRLHDSDRGVRLLAERGIRELWLRFGSDEQREQLRVVIRCNTATQYAEAILGSSELLDQNPWFAEVWNQRAVANFHLEDFEQSIHDCRQTLELNPYHFGAAVGMAHGYLRLDDAYSALAGFRKALSLNPNMEGVRAQLRRLERAMD